MTPPLRLLQANINHCARAQDLLVQSLAEWLIHIAVVSEPYYVLPSGNWVSDLDGLVTVVANAAAGAPSLELVTRGRGCVAARFGDMVVVGCYFSPSRSPVEFEASLSELRAVVRGCNPLPVLVLGDFNAKSLDWGSRLTNTRGRMVEQWALELGLLVLNRGSVPTCVRQQGESVVDISFASPALVPRVEDWRVLEGVETYSDHRYIRFEVSAQSADAPVRPIPGGDGPRWSLRRLDRELLLEASIVQAWVLPPDRPADIDDEAEWFREAMSNICDMAMPRVRPSRARRQVYWWSQEIAALRRACIAVRRQYTRFRRRRIRPPSAAAEEAELYEGYRAAKLALSDAILQARSSAWEGMLGTLDHDPWGRPYKWVREKLRPWAPPLTQSLRPQLLEGVVDALFPSRAEHTPPPMVSPPTTPDADPDEHGDSVPAVSRVDLRVAVDRLGAKNTAPGPDGIPGRAWVLALGALGPRLQGLLSACLERGQFPRRWKTGKLVLIRKPGRPADSPSAYRPIVLLDEVGKLFERVIADRLVGHLNCSGPDLAESQFGFRRGRSTVDAIMRVRDLTEEVVSRGGVALAVSLDIVNAFNSLPWTCIGEALRYHRVPLYLRRLIGAYLSERYVIYPGRDRWIRREMSCGVPQGSVLGPLLWNIGYDWVLRSDLPRGASVVCYADDTLVVARGWSHQSVAALAEGGVATVVARIRQLGLEVALHKSEAMWFHGPRNSLPSGSGILVGGVRIGVGSGMRYLGLTLDSRWNFGDHLRHLAPKIVNAAAAFRRLLPNLRGPGASCRRLYAGVVRSMALYGAPVWADRLTVAKSSYLRRAQRAVAVSLIRGYRTISYEVASLLAGSPPWDLEAVSLARLHEWRGERRRRGETPLPREIAARRVELRQDLMVEWRRRLSLSRRATVVAVRPLLGEWLERRHGDLTYRMTQILTGHGCFSEFLCRIRKAAAPGCHHCDCPEDTAQHTLEVCPAWDEQRRVLTGAIGDDLSLPALVKAIVGSESAWEAVSSFCEDVMRRKEEAGRERERGSRYRYRRGRARLRLGRPPRRRGARDDLQPP